LESIEVSGTRIIKRAEGFLYASELTVMLGKQRYNEGMIDLLTDFADAPNYWSYSTKGGGKIELNNVCIVMLGCSTMDLLGDAIPQKGFGGGFLARIILIVQQQTQRSFAIPKEQDKTIKRELADFLARIRKRSGQFTFSPDGLRWYEDWYHSCRDIDNDLRLNGYFERKPDHLLRVAMLLALAEEVDLILTPDLLQRAERILNAVEPHMPEALREINTSMSGKESNRVMDMIRSKKADGLDYETLMSGTIQYMAPKAVDEAIRGLRLAGKIDEVITPQGRKYTERNGVPYTNGNGHASVEDNELLTMRED
jgi:hypothetical protein